MRTHSILAWILVLLTTVGTIGAAIGYEAYRSHKYRTIELVAHSPLNGNWQPRVLEVEEGQPVRLRIRNVETVSHGFAIPQLGVGVQEIKPGQVVIVTFRAGRPGTFPFMCTVWCTNEHMQMTGELRVSSKVARGSPQ